jgi:hypothetical protein
VPATPGFLALLGPLPGREVHLAAVPAGQVLEGGGLAPPIDEVGGRHAVALALPVRPHHHQPLRVTIRERLEVGRIDDAEDGRVGRDAKREREHGDRGEPGVLAQEAKAEAGVAQEVRHGKEVTRARENGNGSIP